MVKGRIRSLAARLMGGNPADTDYDPAAYWEDRSAELIETYDHPETWDARGWMRAGVEEELIPGLLRDAFEARSVFIVGAGSGRQYGMLAPLGLRLEGIDIAPSLVAECQERFPDIPTTVASIVGAEARFSPSDVVLSSGVLQHVAPDEIGGAVRSIKALARSGVIVRELTMATPSHYSWAHDYVGLFADWELVRQVTTDERPGVVRVELLAFARPGTPAITS